MSLLAVLLLAVSLAYGQSPVGGKAVSGNFEAVKLGDILHQKPLHIHTMPHSCKGEPDRVYGKLDGVYYACIKGKEVCSKEQGAIPGRLIADFDAALREHHAKMQEYRAQRVREGQAVSEDPWANHSAAIAKHQARIAELKQARAESGASRAPAVRSVSATPSVSTIEAAAMPAPAPPPAVAEEQVRGILIGTAKGEVMRKLGEPYLKMTAGFEHFTYLLTSGKEARMEFENGKLRQLRIVPRQ